MAITTPENKQTAPSFHRIKKYRKESKAFNRATNKLVDSLLKLHYYGHNVDTNSNQRINRLPVHIKTELKDRVFEELQMIEQQKSNLSRIQREVVVNLYINLNEQLFNEKENNPKEGEETHTV